MTSNTYGSSHMDESNSSGHRSSSPSSVQENGWNESGGSDIEEISSIDAGSRSGSSLAGNARRSSRTKHHSFQSPKKRRGPKSAKCRPTGLRPKYELSCFVRETSTQQKSDELYDVQLNPFLQSIGQYVLAVAGGNRVSIYECTENRDFQLLQVYSDADKTENFYCVCWSYEKLKHENKDEYYAGSPLLAIAGLRGVIRVLRATDCTHLMDLKGCGGSVNQLKLHPQDPYLLLSASQDHSIRLYNIKTETCIAIFGGLDGHRDEVLCIDFHPTGRRFVSGGMDHALKIWALDSEKVQKAVRDSYKYDIKKAAKQFPTVKCQFPSFTTRNIHRNYVDCVSWYGNLVLSKSCEKAIVLWMPGKLEKSTDIAKTVNNCINQTSSTDQTATVLHKFIHENDVVWFIRFGMHAEQGLLACGNKAGHIFIWQIDPIDPTQSGCTELLNPSSKTPVRQICFSNDGKIMFAISDDSAIWRYDRIAEKVSTMNKK